MKLTIRNIDKTINLSKQEATPKQKTINKTFSNVEDLIKYLQYFKLVKHSSFKLEIEK